MARSEPVVGQVLGEFSHSAAHAPPPHLSRQLALVVVPVCMAAQRWEQTPTWDHNEHIE